ncbi:MAG: glutamate--cysteine ligase, partial [Acidimicrobiia bacterium]
IVLTALAQCLVARFDQQLDAGDDLPFPRDWVMRQNKWLAARYGVDAALIVDEAGTRASTRELVTVLVAELDPVARDLGCVDELAGVLAILETEPSYARQREVVARGGGLVDVVHHLVAEFESDQPETT